MTREWVSVRDKMCRKVKKFEMQLPFYIHKKDGVVTFTPLTPVPSFDWTLSRVSTIHYLGLLWSRPLNLLRYIFMSGPWVPSLTDSRIARKWGTVEVLGRRIWDSECKEETLCLVSNLDERLHSNSLLVWIPSIDHWLFITNYDGNWYLTGFRKVCVNLHLDNHVI